MNFNELDLKKLDKDLSDAERDEWQVIYASYRGRSVISGEVAGVDLHELNIVQNGETKLVWKTVRCLIIINYRVKVIIPETEVFIDELDTGYHILHSMCGANVDYGTCP